MLTALGIVITYGRLTWVRATAYVLQMLITFGIVCLYVMHNADIFILLFINHYIIVLIVPTVLGEIKYKLHRW